MLNAISFPVGGYSPPHSQPHLDHSDNRSTRADQVANNHYRTDPASLSGAVRVGAAERFEKAESFSLSLVTRDGDKVTIQFNSEDSYRSSFAAGRNSNGDSAARFSVDRQHSSEYGFSIEGELDDDELDAISTLVQDIALLADDFFNGDVQQAFDRSLELDFDGQQLAEMNLSLEQSLTYSAVATYQEVQSFGEQNAQGPRALRPFAQQASEHVSQAEIIMHNAASFTQSLMVNLIQQDSRYMESSISEEYSLNKSMLKVESILENLIIQSGELSEVEVESEDES
ncbi:MAG: hypothetical protein V7731_20710 [Amphritea sp.]